MGSHPVSADIIAIIHVAFVAFLIGGFLFSFLGNLIGIESARNPWFRGIHLLAVSYILARTWLTNTCPLTVLEQRLRGPDTMAPDPITVWSHRMVFKGMDHQQFTWLVSIFAGTVFLQTILSSRTIRGLLSNNSENRRQQRDIDKSQSCA